MTDIVTRLRVKDGVYTKFWQQKLMDDAADEIERLQASSLAARHDLHAALIALNDLLADPRTQPDAQRTLRDITSRRKLNVHALRPLTRQAYGT